MNIVGIVTSKFEAEQLEDIARTFVIVDRIHKLNGGKSNERERI